jgi:hypothetical protein
MVPKKTPHRCPFCEKPFETPRALNHHISALKSCYKEWRKNLVRLEHLSPKRPRRNSPITLEGGPESLDLEAVDTRIVDDFDFVPPSPPRRATVEDNDNEQRNTYLRETSTTQMDRFVEPYPGDAGQGLRKSKTRFEKWLEIQEAEGKKPWDPFASKEEWALTGWLIKNVGQKSTDEYLKLQIVSEDDIFFFFKLLIGF